MPFDQRRTLASPTGATLNLYVRSAEGRPLAAVQVNHGLAEHAARYAEFADFLAAHGFCTYAHDHRGHGHTTAEDAPPGRFGTPQGCEQLMADVEAVHDLIAKNHPGLPVILFGHSMGGLIGLNFLFRHWQRVHAAAIWNANFSAGLAGRAALLLLAWERFRLGSDVPSRLLPKLTFRAWARAVPGHQTPFDWLSRDADEVGKYIADPLCGWDPTVSMWRDIFELILAGADDRNFAGMRRDLPMLLVGGASDPATDRGKAVTHLAQRMRAMGFSNLVSKVYAETRHESLNELNRNLIMSDFAVWATAALKQRPRKP